LTVILDSGKCDYPTRGKVLLRVVAAFCGWEPESPEFHGLVQERPRLATFAEYICPGNKPKYDEIINGWREIEEERLKEWYLRARNRGTKAGTVAIEPTDALTLDKYELLPEATVELIGRGMRTIGRLLDAIADKDTILKRPSAIAVRLGSLIVFFGQMAFPKTWFDFTLKNCLRVLLVIEAVLLAGALLLDKGVAPTAVSLLLVTLAVFLVADLLRIRFKAARGTWLTTSALLALVVASVLLIADAAVSIEIGLGSAKGQTPIEHLAEKSKDWWDHLRPSK